MENSSTLFSNKCEILAELWTSYRDDEEFQDFVRYSDLGLPLAYCASAEIIMAGPDDPAGEIINETWDLFLAGLSLDDTGFDNLDELLELAVQKNKDK